MAEEVGERWLIAGRVQGVGYRAWMVQQAQLLGIRGWVRNRVDGRVEAAVIGAADTLARLRHACRQGPSGAQVTEIEVAGEPGRLLAEAAGFSQAPTDLDQSGQ